MAAEVGERPQALSPQAVQDSQQTAARWTRGFTGLKRQMPLGGACPLRSLKEPPLPKHLRLAQSQSLFTGLTSTGFSFWNTALDGPLRLCPVGDIFPNQPGTA